MIWIILGVLGALALISPVLAKFAGGVLFFVGLYLKARGTIGAPEEQQEAREMYRQQVQWTYWSLAILCAIVVITFGGIAVNHLMTRGS